MAAVAMLAMFVTSCEALCPSATSTSAEEIVTPPLRRARIVFLGDVMAHTPQLNAARRGNGYDFSAVFRYVKPIFAKADLVVANLETTLADCPPYGGYPLFRTPAELAQAASEAGVSVMVTANNHSLDAGADGVRETLRILDRCGIGHTGTSATSAVCDPFFADCGGVRIALLNYTYGTNGIATPASVSVNRIDTVAMARDIARCADADVRICFLHWGSEYARRPSVEQRLLRDFLRRHGVAVVIGSHPHVVQRAECTADDVVVYSLGNFVSNQSERYTDGGVIAAVDIVEIEKGEFDYLLDIIPVWVHRPDYAVLPSSVGNTMKMDAAQREAYTRFIHDTEQIFRKM